MLKNIFLLISITFFSKTSLSQTHKSIFLNGESYSVQEESPVQSFSYGTFQQFYMKPKKSIKMNFEYSDVLKVNETIFYVSRLEGLIYNSEGETVEFEQPKNMNESQRILFIAKSIYPKFDEKKKNAITLYTFDLNYNK